MSMNILVLGSDSIFAGDVAWGFAELGHTVHSHAGGDLEQIKWQQKPELIITFGSPMYYLGKGIVEQIKKIPALSDAVYVHWDTDGITWRDLELSLISVGNPDFVFTVCPDMLAVLRDSRVPCALLSYAFCPKTHFPVTPPCAHDGSIAFVGSAYPEVVLRNGEHMRSKSMANIIKPLLENGKRVDFWGDWRHGDVMQKAFGCTVPGECIHGRLHYSQTTQIYSSCFINLVPQNHNKHLTKRTYEILGAGGFILTYDTAEVRQRFTHGKELVIASSPEQTLQLVDYYKTHMEEYNAIRVQALQSAQNETYKQRAEEILAQVL